MAASPQHRYPQRGLHAGYLYQDLVAALACCAVLARGRGTVSVESARSQGDPFDDVVTGEDAELRMQVKHREARPELPADVFADGDLTIEALVAARTEDASASLRLVTTWMPPVDVPAWLRQSGAAPSLAGLDASRWGLDAAGVWPESGDPIWPALRDTEREDLVAFCEQFVLELGCAPMSGSLAEPGPLELALLTALREQVGVERHPNSRDAVDVAARLLAMTTAARSRRQRSFSFQEIARELDLQIDRGRIPQVYPLDPSRFVERPAFRERLLSVQADSSRVVLEGPPGAGKSWALEALARERGDEMVVARHYCFLEPGDPYAQGRVALEAMSANLVSEILDDPELSGVGVGVGGDLPDLRRTLAAAADTLARGSGRKLLLIVDGLDHVARVDVEGAPAPWDPDDFAEELARLDLPEGCSLVVGSQPGPHLDVLRAAGAAQVEVPHFTEEETARQLQRAGTLAVLESHGRLNQRDAVVDAVHELAAGNPLFVSFLAQEILDLLESQPNALPVDALRAISVAPGDLGAYYDYLLVREGDSAAGLVADHLAVIDFAVTVHDLSAMLPSLGPERIETALRRLRPVLSSVAGQGGYRIYHESLRRHVVERRTASGGSVGPLLNPVIDWLEARGFYLDARAFRHLLPALRRAGYADRVLEWMRPDFVSSSVVHFQPQRAVLANIRLASNLAAESGDLVALSGLSELRRAAQAAFEEKLADVTAYAEAYVELFGADRLAEQLLYEGRPVLDRSGGMQLCALIDRAGGIAPWRAYLDLRRPSRTPFNRADERFRENVVELRGKLRLADPDAVIESVAQWLVAGPEPRVDYLEELTRATIAVLGPDALARILDAAGSADPGRLIPLRLAAAEVASAEGRRAEAEALAEQIDVDRLQLTEVTRMKALGLLPPGFATALGDPVDAADAVLSNRHRGDQPAVAKLRVALPIWAEAGVDLVAVRQQFDGVGWYRRWLRFLVDLARAPDSAAVLRALAEVAADTHPFSGEPRAMDLYDIKGEVEASFRDALARVADEDLAPAVDSLARIARGTTTYLQRSASGPLTLIPLLRVLLPHAERVSLDAVEAEIRDRWANEYYEAHAEALLAFAQLCERAGESDRAQVAWDEAGRYLAAYGMRKDITLFGPIEALEACEERGDARVTDRLRRLRPLTDRAVYHSDGAETKHLPGAWFEAFAASSPGAAADSLARSIRQHEPTAYWMHESALADAAKASRGLIPPLLEHCLWRCVPARHGVEERLAAVDALAAVDSDRAREASAEVAAAAEGDAERRDSGGSNSSGAAASDEQPDRGPFLAEIDDFVSLLAWAREFSLAPLGSPIDADALTAELLNKLDRLQLSDTQIQAIAQGLSRGQVFLRRADVLVVLAERHAAARPQLAADLYVLAWCAGRAGGGWKSFGGVEQRDLLVAAAECDQTRARFALAREVANLIGTEDYALGMAQRLFEALAIWGDLDSAFAAWDRAVDVVEHRLPSLGREPDTFLVPGADLSDAEAPAAFGRLLAACLRHPEYERRCTALAGFAELVPAEPELAATMLRFALEADFTLSDLLALLGVVDASGEAGVRVRAGLEALVGSVSDSLGFGLPDSPGRRVNWDEIEEALGLDPTDRVERLAQAWRELARHLAERYWALYEETPQHEEVMKSQSELQFSRSSGWVPPLLLHQWRHELFECALHDTLPAFRRHMFVTGRWRAGDAERLTAMVNPDAAAGAARGRSRIVRPASLPLAAEAEAGEHDLLLVGDGPYVGWTVAGFLERHIEEVDHFDRGRQTLAYGGLVVPPFDAGDGLPFLVGQMDFAWHRQGPGSTSQRDVAGALTSGWVQRDALAWDKGLTLREDVRLRLGLTAAALPAAFDLLNEAGDLSTVWRRWRTRPFDYDYGPPTPLVAGGVLLLSPVTAEALAALATGALRMVVSVATTELSPPS